MSGDDLISRSALFEDIRSNITECTGIMEWLNLIDRQPTIKAVPVVCGEWIRHENTILEECACECSNCHAKTYCTRWINAMNIIGFTEAFALTAEQR